jgi:hypothetical protein
MPNELGSDRRDGKMVGRLKISKQAEAVRRIFMDLEEDAKKIKTCWLCDSQLSAIKSAHQGHFRGNHKPECPFEKLAIAGEECIIVRHGDQQTRQAAEKVLSERIDSLLAAMTEEIVPTCPFPICGYSFEIGHRLECPLNRLKSASGHPA